MRGQVVAVGGQVVAVGGQVVAVGGLITRKKYNNDVISGFHIFPHLIHEQIETEYEI